MTIWEAQISIWQWPASILSQKKNCLPTLQNLWRTKKKLFLYSFKLTKQSINRLKQVTFLSIIIILNIYEEVKG